MQNQILSRKRITTPKLNNIFTRLSNNIPKPDSIFDSCTLVIKLNQAGNRLSIPSTLTGLIFGLSLVQIREFANLSQRKPKENPKITQRNIGNDTLLLLC